jgi:hypothetical protein
MAQKKPVIFGVGGLLEKDEKGRVTEILSRLSQLGCSTYEVKFSRICRNGNTVVCPVSPAWVGDVTATIATALQDPEIDTSRVGLVGSSIGAAIMDQHLASEDTLTGREINYVAISPFSKVNPTLRPMLEGARNMKKDIPMTSDIDRERGIERIIPHSDISTILEIDTPKALISRPNSYQIIPLTIYGLKDERVDVSSIVERHRVLGGPDNQLFGFDCRHNTPYDESVSIAINFLKERLSI